METLVVAVLLWICIPVAGSRPTQVLFEPQSVNGLCYYFVLHPQMICAFCNLLHEASPFVHRFLNILCWTEFQSAHLDPQDFLNKNLDDLLDCFIKEYEASWNLRANSKSTVTKNGTKYIEIMIARGSSWQLPSDHDDELWWSLMNFDSWTFMSSVWLKNPPSNADPGWLDAKNDQTVSQASGGPKLDRAELRWQFTLSALQQGVGLLGAVPQIYKMCKKPETWRCSNLWLNTKPIQIDGWTSRTNRMIYCDVVVACRSWTSCGVPKEDGGAEDHTK